MLSSVLELLPNLKSTYFASMNPPIETDCIRVILKNIGQTFFKFMANHLDKGRFFSESSCLWCNDNFISKGIPHYHFRVLNISPHSLTQSSEPRWGSIRHRQTSSIQTGPGPATAARSTSFQLFSSGPRWSSAKCRVVYPGASSQGAPKTAPWAGAGLCSCEGHGQATSTVFFSPPERCYSPLCASRSPHCTPFLAFS